MSNSKYENCYDNYEELLKAFKGVGMTPNQVAPECYGNLKNIKAGNIDGNIGGDLHIINKTVNNKTTNGTINLNIDAKS